MYREKEIDDKELVHMVVEADKSKICRVAWQTVDAEGPIFHFEFESHHAGGPGIANFPI